MYKSHEMKKNVQTTSTKYIHVLFENTPPPNFTIKKCLKSSPKTNYLTNGMRTIATNGLVPHVRQPNLCLKLVSVYGHIQ